MAVGEDNNDTHDLHVLEAKVSGDAKVMSNILDGSSFFDDVSSPILRARDIRNFKEYKALRGVDHDNLKLISGLGDSGALGKAWRAMIAAPENELWDTIHNLRQVRKENSKCPMAAAMTPITMMADNVSQFLGVSPFIAPPTQGMSLSDDNLLYSEFLTYWEDFVVAPDDGTVGRPGRTVCPFSPTVALLGTLLCKIVRHEGLATLDESAWTQLENFFANDVLPVVKTETFWEEKIESLETYDNKKGWKAPGENIEGTQPIDQNAAFTSKTFSKFQVMVFLFPDFTLNEAAAARLVTMRQKLKPLFVKHDLMFIPFHMHNLDRPSKGARATQSCPGRSLVPFLQIRPITAMDLPYVKPDPYTMAQGFSQEQMVEMEAAWQERLRKIRENHAGELPHSSLIGRPMHQSLQHIKCMASPILETGKVLQYLFARKFSARKPQNEEASFLHHGSPALWGCALTCFLSAVLVTKLRNK